MFDPLYLHIHKLGGRETRPHIQPPQSDVPFIESRLIKQVVLIFSYLRLHICSREHIVIKASELYG